METFIALIAATVAQATGSNARAVRPRIRQVGGAPASLGYQGGNRASALRAQRRDERALVAKWNGILSKAEDTEATEAGALPYHEHHAHTAREWLTRAQEALSRGDASAAASALAYASGASDVALSEPVSEPAEIEVCSLIERRVDFGDFLDSGHTGIMEDETSERGFRRDGELRGILEIPSDSVTRGECRVTFPDDSVAGLREQTCEAIADDLPYLPAGNWRTYRDTMAKRHIGDGHVVKYRNRAATRAAYDALDALIRGRNGNFCSACRSYENRWQAYGRSESLYEGDETGMDLPPCRLTGEELPDTSASDIYSERVVSLYRSNGELDRFGDERKRIAYARECREQLADMMISVIQSCDSIAALDGYMAQWKAAKAAANRQCVGIARWIQPPMRKVPKGYLTALKAGQTGAYRGADWALTLPVDKVRTCKVPTASIDWRDQFLTAAQWDAVSDAAGWRLLALAIRDSENRACKLLAWIRRIERLDVLVKVAQSVKADESRKPRERRFPERHREVILASARARYRALKASQS